MTNPKIIPDELIDKLTHDSWRTWESTGLSAQEDFRPLVLNIIVQTLSTIQKNFDQVLQHEAVRLDPKGPT